MINHLLAYMTAFLGCHFNFSQCKTWIFKLAVLQTGEPHQTTALLTINFLEGVTFDETKTPEGG